LYLAPSGFRILILKDASALANAEALLFENQFGFRISTELLAHIFKRAII